MFTQLTSADSDVLVHIFSFLRPPEILCLRQTCKLMCTISYLRIVWTNACNFHILQNGYPFPTIPLSRMSVQELERRVCHAYHLAAKWCSENWTTRNRTLVDVNENSVSKVRFVPGYDGTLILTISMSVWSVITIWNIAAQPKKCLTWSPKGAIFNGFALNTDVESKATLALSVLKDGEKTVQILSLQRKGDNMAFDIIYSHQTNFKPITLNGDLLALSDDGCQTAIWNWANGKSAILQTANTEQEIWQNNYCLSVLFAYQSVLVVRARSLSLFPMPELRSSEDTLVSYEPLASHSFGWIDGISVTLYPRVDSYVADASQKIAILVRAKTDDFWSRNNHTIDLHMLFPNTDYESSDNGTYSSASESLRTLPYSFPPIKMEQVRSLRGPLNCCDVKLGPCGTALWIQPQDRTLSGLIWDPGEGYPPIMRVENGYESLIATVFPGPLHSYPESKYSTADRKEGKDLCVNMHNNWTSLDYDEDLGKIVIGSSLGQILILDL